jgi:malic enzyme
MINTVPVTSLDTLRKVYTPGVAQVSNLIAAQPIWKDARPPKAFLLSSSEKKELSSSQVLAVILGTYHFFSPLKL